MNKSGFIIVKKRNKVGLHNQEGQEVLPCIYDQILDYDDDGYIRIIIGGVYGTIDLECHEVIPHSLGLTHLGVFHGGTARAKKGKNWGLVDVKGNTVTGFCYQDIKAHYNNGYSVINNNGEKGFLSEDGQFTPSKKASNVTPIQPKPIVKHIFNQFRFNDKLRNWIYGYSDEIDFYYRDTNLDFEVEKVYKSGMLLRAGEYLEITDKLRQPVHNTRFVIASNNVTNTERVINFNISYRESLQKEITLKKDFLHFNSCFMVLSVEKIGKLHQILLLHLPQQAIQIAEKYNYTSEMKKYLENECKTTIEKAQTDLSDKLGKCVHGYSLSSDWQQRMSSPVGLNNKHKPLSLVPASEDDLSEIEKQMSYITTLLTNDSSSDWDEID